MSGPVPSPSMKGMMGRSGTSRRRSASRQTISWPSAGGVKSLYVLATACSSPEDERGGAPEAKAKSPYAGRYAITTEPSSPRPSSPVPSLPPSPGEEGENPFGGPSGGRFPSPGEG